MQIISCHRIYSKPLSRLPAPRISSSVRGAFSILIQPLRLSPGQVFSFGCPPWGDIYYKTSFKTYQIPKYLAKLSSSERAGNFHCPSGIPSPSRLSGISVDKSGDVYVSDFTHYRIIKYSGNGALRCEWGSFGSANGQFSCPYGLAANKEGNI
jgi:hypothetical protein